MYFLHALSFRLSLFTVMILCVSSAVFASGANQNKTAAPGTGTSSAQTDSYGKVIIKNGDRDIVFTKMPQKVISANMASTEDMLLLGLKDKLVGRNVRTNPAEIPLPEIEAGFYAIP
jgi:ABC-type Fe3+-hydroxamate transport system substrate-binding protein